MPLDETIKILVNKAFTGDWFNKTYGLNLQQDQLARLLEIATTNQLFQFNGQLYQQTDGVAMGSPLGPLMANVFMCHLEEKLTREGLMPQLYKRYVDDTLARMPSVDVAAEFLSTLNGLHPSLTFTMGLPVDNKIPFIGIEIVKNGTKLETQVYRKPTNTGLLLHFQSHTDKRYKDSLLETMFTEPMTYRLPQRLLMQNVSNCALFSVVLTTLWALLIPLSLILFIEMLRQA